MIFHIVNRIEWDIAVQQGSYAPPSLASEGFIHCSTADQVAGAAKRFFKGRNDLILVCIDEQNLAADLEYEPPADMPDSTQLFPHIFGPLNLDAVVEVVDFLPIGH